MAMTLFPHNPLFPQGKRSACEVSPLDGTALVTAVSIPSNVRLETSRLGPMMTGPTKTEDRRGMKLQRSYHRDREFPRSPEGART